MKEKIIGAVLFISGFFFLFFSIQYNINSLTLIGLSFILWGIIFELIITKNYINSLVLSNFIYSNMKSLDDLLQNLNLHHNPIYIPFSKENFLLFQIDVENEFIFIPNFDDELQMILEESYRKNPKGIRFSPPGLELVNYFEKKHSISFHDVSADNLYDVLILFLRTENELIDDLEIKIEDYVISVYLKNLKISNICGDKSLEYICPSIGSPLCSSIGVILIRVFKKPLIIEGCVHSNNNLNIKYKILNV